MLAYRNIWIAGALAFNGQAANAAQEIALLIGRRILYAIHDTGKNRRREQRGDKSRAKHGHPDPF